MSEIKYRVWNVRRWLKETEVAITPDGKILVLDRDEEIWRENVHYDLKIVQCTGLTDRNGKEIYEGDVLEISDRPLPQKVYFDQEGFYCTEEFALFELNRSEGRTFEVIGNIYENPKLIEVSA